MSDVTFADEAVQRRIWMGEVATRGMEGLTRIEGYGAVFYDADDPGTEYPVTEDYVERILPGAFDASLSAAADIRVSWNHDASQLLGRRSAGTARISADKRGLWYSVDAPDTSYARDLLELLRREDVPGSSIMFRVAAGGWQIAEDEAGRIIRSLTRLDLIETGPVSYPAYAATSVSARSAALAARRELLQKSENRKQVYQRDIDRVRMQLDLIRRRIHLGARE